MSIQNKAAVVRQALKKEGIKAEEKEINGWFLFCGTYNIEGDRNATLSFRLTLEDSEGWLRMLVIFQDVVVPVDAYIRVSEFITRINYRLNFGRFEMNFDNGQIRFTSCQDISVLEGKGANDILIRQFIRAIAISERLYPFLKLVVHGEIPPEVANSRFRNN